MKYVIVLLFLSLFILGCAQNTQPPPDTINSNNTIVPPIENKTTIVIKNSTEYEPPIIGNQTLPPSLQPPTGPVVTPSYLQTPNDKFAIYFINTGTDGLQGDAILIKKGEFDMLIDTGTEVSGPTVVDFLKSHGVDDLEVLASTNADPDHYGGMKNVLDTFGVEEFWWSGKLYGDKTYENLIRSVNDRSISIKEVSRGENYSFNGLQVLVLNPSATRSFGDRDNDAITLKITQDQFCTLLTSGILAGAQADVINIPNFNPHCNILEIPGHGLGRATTNIGPFLVRIAPTDVIFSGARDDPSADKKGTRFILYDKLNATKTKYYENYKNGTVRITSDGFQYIIEYLTE